MKKTKKISGRKKRQNLDEKNVINPPNPKKIKNMTT